MSHTWRWMPPPGYQREELGGLSTLTAMVFFWPNFRKGREVHAEGAVPVFPFAGQVSVYIDFRRDMMPSKSR